MCLAAFWHCLDQQGAHVLKTRVLWHVRFVYKQITRMSLLAMYWLHRFPQCYICSVLYIYIIGIAPTFW